MRCRDEDDARHEWQRFDEERAGEQVTRLGVKISLVKRDLGTTVPKASSAIDHSHLSEETALAVTYDDHMIEGWVLAIGVDVLADG